MEVFRTLVRTESIFSQDSVAPFEIEDRDLRLGKNGMISRPIVVRGRNLNKVMGGCEEESLLRCAEMVPVVLVSGRWLKW